MAELGYSLSQPSVANSATSMSFGFRDTDLSELQCSADGYLAPEKEHAVAHIRGIDFWIILPFDAFDAHDVKEVWVSVKGAVANVSLCRRGPADFFRRTQLDPRLHTFRTLDSTVLPRRLPSPVAGHDFEAAVRPVHRPPPLLTMDSIESAA